MNEVRVCNYCGAVFERDHRHSSDGRAVTTYQVYGAQSQSSGLLETQHAHWNAGTCPSCGAKYEQQLAESPSPLKQVPLRKKAPSTEKKRPSAKAIVWFVLKLFPTLIMLSCCITSVQDMAWVRGATGESSPLIATLVGYTVLFYWAYCVIWTPIKPSKAGKQ